MLKKKQQVLILTGLIIVMAVVFSCRFFYRSIDNEQYRKVASGMKIAQVENILGKPVKISKYFCPEHGPSEVWHYNVRYSLFVVTVWFKPSEDGEMCVVDKIWGFVK